MSIPQHVGSQLRTCDAVRGQALQHRLCTAAQLDRCRGGLSGKTFEQSHSGRSLEQFDQSGVTAPLDRIRPKSSRLEPRCGEVSDGAVELFQSVAQGSSDARVLEGGIYKVNVDLQGIGVTLPATQQRSERSVFLRCEFGNAKAFDRSVERRTFETLAQTFAERGEMVATEQASKPRFG